MQLHVANKLSLPDRCVLFCGMMLLGVHNELGLCCCAVVINLHRYARTKGLTVGMVGRLLGCQTGDNRKGHVVHV